MHATLTITDTDTLRARGLIVTDALRTLNGHQVELPVLRAGEPLKDHGRLEALAILRDLEAAHPGVTRIDWDHTRRTGYVQVHGREVGTLSITTQSYEDVTATALALLDA